MTYDCNIIFLDFDGVLTAKCNSTFFTNDSGNYTFSESHVKILEKLCEETHSKIVIASNWRRFADDGVMTISATQKYMNPLPKLRARLKDLIVGQYPADRRLSKANALELWFIYNDVNGKYVILDDDLREDYQNSMYKDNFILVDNTYGLNDEVVEKAKAILTSES